MMKHRIPAGKIGLQFCLSTALGLGLLLGGCGSEPEEEAAVEETTGDARSEGDTGSETGEAGEISEDAADAGDGMEGDDGSAAEGSEDSGDMEGEAGEDAGGASGQVDQGALDALLAAYQAMSEQSGWRMTQQIDSSGAGEMTQVLEFQKPDRFQMEMAGNEVVVIGDQAWVNMAGTWVENQQMGSMVNSALEQIPGAGGQIDSTAYAASMQLVEDLGDERVEGQAARKIRYTTGSPETGTVEVTVWIGRSDGLPIRQEMHSAFGEFEADMSADFEYGDIEIEAPEGAGSD